MNMKMAIAAMGDDDDDVDNDDDDETEDDDDDNDDTDDDDDEDEDDDDDDDDDDDNDDDDNDDDEELLCSIHGFCAEGADAADDARIRIGKDRFGRCFQTHLLLTLGPLPTFPSKRPLPTMRSSLCISR